MTELHEFKHQQVPAPAVQPQVFSRFYIPATEGVKYAGSKLRLLGPILRLVGKVHARTVFDGFAGTTRVSQALAQLGCRVVCNDAAAWSEVFGTCYLLNHRPRSDYKELIAHLNQVPPADGWFTEHYGGTSEDGFSFGPDGLKKPWQIHNTRKLDGIREEIDRMGLNGVEKAVALSSLMLALDQVDNTLGHFVSYLNKWSARSYKELVLSVPGIFAQEQDHEVLRQDIFDAAGHVQADVAYLDPPYGSNNEKMPPSRVRYGSYYHLWTTICLNDRPELFGRAKRRNDTSDPVAGSVFEEFRRDEQGRFLAVEAIERMLKAVQARWIILSYSSGGRATAAELNRAIRKNGTLAEVVEVDYRRNVMGSMTWTDQWLRDAEEPNREFIFLIEKK